jgi:iron-siderophore transport system permease protein
VSVTKSSSPAAVPPSAAPARGGRPAAFIAALLLLLTVVAASLAIGARQFSLGEVWHGLLDPHAPAYTVVRETRLPRTLLGLLAGIGLGLAGGVMQALTRNPLADPGLLGINAGASAAIVSAITFLGSRP